MNSIWIIFWLLFTVLLPQVYSTLLLGPVPLTGRLENQQAALSHGNLRRVMSEPCLNWDDADTLIRTVTQTCLFAKTCY